MSEGDQTRNVDQEIAEFVEMFGDRIPDPDHEPIRLNYYIKLFRYAKSQESVERSPVAQ